MKSDLTSTFLGMAPGSEGRIVVLGLPFDQGATSAYGCAQGSKILRVKSAYLNLKQGHFYHSGTGHKILENISISDAGDLKYSSHTGHDKYFQKVRDSVSALISHRKKILVLGGDHLMTLPVIEGISEQQEAFQVIQIDAHTDCHRVEDLDRPTHSNFIHFVSKISQCEQILQIGVRAASRELPSISKKIKSIQLNDLASHIMPGVPVYLTVDTDGFDPQIAPGVGHPVVQGLLWSDLTAVLSCIREVGSSFIGADWMEYNPEFDSKNFITAAGIVPSLVQIIQALGR